jgi:hypothetical protein
MSQNQVGHCRVLPLIEKLFYRGEIIKHFLLLFRGGRLTFTFDMFLRNRNMCINYKLLEVLMRPEF